MKITVITDDKGEIVGTTRGHSKDSGRSADGYAVLRPSAGQTFREVDAPEEFATYDAAELHKHLKAHMYQGNP